MEMYKKSHTYMKHLYHLHTTVKPVRLKNLESKKHILKNTVKLYQFYIIQFNLVHCVNYHM